jgi:hypothetical protein
VRQCRGDAWRPAAARRPPSFPLLRVPPARRRKADANGLAPRSPLPPPPPPRTCSTKPTRRLACFENFAPLTVTRPEVRTARGARPEMTDSSDVLPLPLGPLRAWSVEGWCRGAAQRGGGVSGWLVAAGPPRRLASDARPARAAPPTAAARPSPPKNTRAPHMSASTSPGMISPETENRICRSSGSRGPPLMLRAAPRSRSRRPGGPTRVATKALIRW